MIYPIKALVQILSEAIEATTQFTPKAEKKYQAGYVAGLMRAAEILKETENEDTEA